MGVDFDVKHGAAIESVDFDVKHGAAISFVDTQLRQYVFTSDSNSFYMKQQVQKLRNPMHFYLSHKAAESRDQATIIKVIPS